MLTNLPESSLKKPPAFPTEFGECDRHGKYIAREEISGVIYAHVGGCKVCRAEQAAASLMSGCNVPTRFSHATLDNFIADTPAKSSVLDACGDYASNFRNHRSVGRGLILCGEIGTGKNHLCTGIFKRLREQRFTCLRVKAAEFLDAYWAKSFSERDEWVREMARVDLLHFDEIGRSSQGAGAQQALFRVIDARYENVMPTLITTNLTRNELVEVLGDAAYDRVRQGGTRRYTLSWASFRPEAVVEAQA